MVRYLRLYGLFLTQRLKILMEYRLNFFIGAFSFVLMQSVGRVGDHAPGAQPERLELR